MLRLIGGFIFFTIMSGMAQLFQSAIFPNWLNSALLLAGGAVLLVLYRYWGKYAEKRETKDIALREMPGTTAKGLLTGFAYFATVTAIMALAGSYHIESVQFRAEYQLLHLCLFFTVAVSEEIVFRGILFRQLDERWGTWVAFAVSALFFGLLHLPNDNATLWSSFAIALEAGLLLAAAYKYSGSLWLPIGIHWAWNYTQGNIFGFGVSGSQPLPTIITPRLTGPEWLTGGAFGAEASVVAVVCGLILSLWFIRHISKVERLQTAGNESK